MQTTETRPQRPEAWFEDPVAYLGVFGIEAELVAVVDLDQPLAPAAA